MKQVNTQIAKSMTADFEEKTWTFLMPDGFQVWAGQFAIVDKQLYDKIITALDLREECRNYLMSVETKDLCVEDALENLGFGRNGLMS